MELRISHDVSKSRKIFSKVNKQLFKKVKKTVLVKTKNSKSFSEKSNNELEEDDRAEDQHLVGVHGERCHHQDPQHCAR